MRVTRRKFVAVAGLGALAGCTGSGGSGADGDEDADPDGGGGGDGGEGSASGGDDLNSVGEVTPTTTEPSSIDEAIPTAEEALPLSRAPDELRSLAVSGGPPKDGIPSIDNPVFVGPREADFLESGDPVFGVARNGEIKAYPQKILVQHETVNDHLGDEPVAVTYCPLTGTVQGFQRGKTTFGVSGRLINNNLIMYDRATEAWWPQIPATSIPGPWHDDPGTHSLREFRLVWTTWEQWLEQHPGTWVLSTETGSARNYSNDPYGAYNPPTGYYTSEKTLFQTLSEDDRFSKKRVFMGARTPAGAVAFDKETLLEEGTMTGQIGDTPVVAVTDPRFDTGYVYLNPEERQVAFEDGTVLLEGAEHDPDGLPLTRVHTFDAMWFAWIGYYPESNVYA